MTRGPQASCLSHEPAAPLKSEESTPGQHSILYPSVFDQKKKGKKLSLRKTYTALPNPQDPQTLVFSPFRRAISLHHPIPQKASTWGMKKHPPPHLRPGGSAALPRLARSGAGVTGRPRRTKDAPEGGGGGGGRRSRVTLEASPPQPLGPKHQRPPRSAGKLPRETRAAPLQPRASSRDPEHGVAQLREGGAPRASHRSQLCSGARVRRGGLRGTARAVAHNGRRPQARGHPHPPLTFTQASPGGPSREQRWPEAGSRQGRCPFGSSCSSSRRRGLRLPQPRAERSPPPSALRAASAARAPPRTRRAACLLRVGASPLRSAPPLRAADARPPLK